MDRAHTHLYSDRDRIQTQRESQTEDLVGKMEERTNRIIELPGRTRAVRIGREQLQRKVVQTVRIPYNYRTDRTDYVQLLYRFCTTTIQPYGSARVGGRTSGCTVTQRGLEF